MEWVVETENLVKTYRDRSGVVKALDGVSVRVPRGVLFGLFGPNGSGKSTLISILVGLQLPDSGSARVLGFDAIRESVEIRKRVGLMPENYGFYERMTAYENLEYLGLLDGIPESQLKERIMSVLELVGLKEAANRKVGGFSRGMMQRLALAQALLKDPELLILDEPTLGLDPQGVQMFRELVGELLKQGKTIIISTHLLREIGYLCTHAALIKLGKVTAQGSIEQLSEIYSKEKGYRWEVMVSDRPEDFFRAVKSLPGVTEVTLSNNKVVVSASRDVKEEILQLARGFKLESITPLTPTWEELYRFFEGGGWE